ncbi:hypothetical protein RCL_jg694.t1 [Rhizophagus clarus]|uniref:Uncharacterized protein n=1 Tax=Rhizophagus clarus TaxID=94130 RepID=A0A8H3QLH5_9GLOM|nr:hypothetical protein RCL_jg694.t1 [Rhizophagus clarus]
MDTNLNLWYYYRIKDIIESVDQLALNQRFETQESKNIKFDQTLRITGTIYKIFVRKNGYVEDLRNHRYDINYLKAGLINL